MKQPAFLTIVSNNYLHYARTLMQSVAHHHPEARRYCVIVDRDLQPGLALADELTAIPLSALALPFGDEFTFQYTILELNTAVKPWALAYLLAQGHDAVLYIDPDIRLYQPLAEVFALLAAGASIVLTPHLLAPMEDRCNPNELAIRQAGSYNLGFCAISRQPAAQRFLAWWQGKLARDCVVDLASGIFVDQSWVDLVPGMFDQVAILRHPGYNVAYWNLAQRTVEAAGDGYLVNGEPLRFFHFSGVDPQDPRPVSKHQDRFTLATVGAAAGMLILDYCKDVVGNGQAAYARLPYGFGSFSDGTPIPPHARSQLRLSRAQGRAVDGKPYDHPQQQRAGYGPARLRGIFQYFLVRPADPQAILELGERCDRWPGYVRTALGVGRSAESRRQRGWLVRLLLWPLAGPFETARAPSGGPAPAASPHTGAGPAQGGINLVGYIAAELGVGEAARALARACTAAAVPYSVVDVGYQSSNLQRDTQALAGAARARYAIDVVVVNADQTPATIAHLKANRLEGRYRIGFWHWEQTRLPETYQGAFALLDEIWVPSGFVRDAVAAVSPLPVFVVPHALQFAASPGAGRGAFGIPDGKLAVLVMYDFHSYQYRKNPQAAVAAFRRAAAGRSDAVLVVKTINGHHHPQAQAELKAMLEAVPGAVVIDGFLTRQQVWDLQASCDMLVSLHRAEGFGLAPAEMMYLGKPVVATGWSGNMDFMNAENSMPVKYTLEALAEAVGAYEAGPAWAQADVAHAAACLGQLFDDAALRARIGARAAQDVRQMLAPAEVGQRVAARLTAILRHHPELRFSTHRLFPIPRAFPPRQGIR
jgi:glycosyltransferase involved in cell wall biosynthesis